MQHVYVRRWDRHGYMVDSSTHYAVIEWEDGEFEEVEQHDRSVERIGRDDLEAELVELETELAELESPLADELSPIAFDVRRNIRGQIAAVRNMMQHAEAGRRRRFDMWRVSRIAPPSPEPIRLERAA